MIRTRTIRSAIVLLSTAAALSVAGAQSLAPASHPVPNNQMVIPETSSVFTGALGFNFIITITPTVPTDYTITCTATVSPIDAGALFTSDTKSVKAVRTGNSAVCNFAIHYAWTLTSGSDMVNTTYTVSAVGTTSSLVLRASSGNTPSIALPANGSSTSRTLYVTI